MFIFVNWIQSGFVFVKDLFDNNGVLYSANHIFNSLLDKRNWISEYSIIKSIFGNLGKIYNTSLSKSINGKTNFVMLCNNSIIELQNVTTKILY